MVGILESGPQTLNISYEQPSQTYSQQTRNQNIPKHCQTTTKQFVYFLTLNITLHIIGTGVLSFRVLHHFIKSVLTQKHFDSSFDHPLIAGMWGTRIFQCGLKII